MAGKMTVIAPTIAPQMKRKKIRIAAYCRVSTNASDQQHSFNAQKILFFLMYNKKEEYSKKELAIDLALDPVYVTRGSKELVARGFVKHG